MNGEDDNDMFETELEGGTETVTQDPPEGSEKQSSTPPNDAMLTALQELSTTVKGLQAPKNEGKKEMTEEEKLEFWGVYNPTKTRPDFFKKFFNLGEDADEMTVKERQELFAEMQGGMMKQVFTGVKHLLDQYRSEIQQEYSPIREHVAEQRAQQTRAAFDTAYPVFADKRYDKVLRAAASDLQASGKSYKTKDEYFKALAESAAESIKAIVPDFDLGSPQTTTKKAPGSTPKLPRTTVGGSGGIRSGAAGAAAGRPTGDQSDDIFD